MAVFNSDDELNGDLAFTLVQNSFVTKFMDVELLGETLRWLTERGYQVVTIDARTRADGQSMLMALAESLDFPDYFGQNLAAFNDCLSDVVDGSYGRDPHATGLVLVLRRYDTFAAREPAVAHAIVDIVADQARRGALFGVRILCLVQSDDPDLDLPPVGATPVVWNNAEWLTARRRERRAGL